MPVIQVQKLSKQYSIGENKAGNASVGGQLKKLITGFSAGKKEQFWALRDISFTVEQGDVLGIIGRNGAGKSTLLKLISRITYPTEGTIDLVGKTASLLEVGTGFHPELTGRENVYLNGTLLGMSRKEVRTKFDEIVAFSGVVKFIDTPVKHYSSGMYVRLAFSVAAHLEPEILIVDEVLAVGDVAFQKKCLGKMRDVSSQGRTILFVSHNIQAVRTLCSRGILLHNGEMVIDADVEEASNKYNNLLRESGFDDSSQLGNEQNRRGDGSVRFTSLKLTNSKGQEQGAFLIDQAIIFKLTFKLNQEIKNLSIAVSLRSGITRELVTSVRHSLPSNQLKSGREYSCDIEIPTGSLRPGEYPLYFWLGDDEGRAFDVVDDIVAPLIIRTDDSFELLGYDPSVHSGYYSVPSSIKINL